MKNIICLYYLDHSAFSIIEIERTNLPEDAKVSERFFWLKVYKNNDNIEQLIFRSMDSSQEIEERYFEQGFLKFTATDGNYIEKFNTAQYELKRIDKEALPVTMLEKIAFYLQQSTIVNQQFRALSSKFILYKQSQNFWVE